MTTPTEPPGNIPGTTAEERRGKLRILLVEDHADTAAILGRLLRKMGHEVVQASSVAAALAAAEAEPGGGRLDLVISDVGLPDGSGLDMMRILSSKYGLRGIALSGFGRDSDIEMSLLSGFTSHLVKPISASALRKAVTEIVAEG